MLAAFTLLYLLSNENKFSKRKSVWEQKNIISHIRLILYADNGQFVSSLLLLRSTKAVSGLMLNHEDLRFDLRFYQEEISQRIVVNSSIWYPVWLSELNRGNIAINFSFGS